MSEKECGKVHFTIVGAIRHAEERLGRSRNPLQPYWGTTRENIGFIVGFQINSRKRWRLDYDREKRAHVNEENFDAPVSEQKTVHKISGIGEITGDLQIRLQWQKWTSGAGYVPDKVREEIEFNSRQKNK